MSRELTHQQIVDLLGAFALDAVDGDEAEAVELHLRDCPQCRAEVTEHREVAAMLAHTGAPAPEGVWTSILEELEPAPPELRMPSAPVSSLAAHRSTVRMRTLVAVLSAAAVVVSVLGVVAVRQSNRLERMDAALRDVSIDRIANQTMSDPRATTGKLVSADKQVNAPVVVNAKGMGYLLAAKLPELAKGRTYQLWGQVGGSVVSLGVFDGRTDVVQFQVGGSRREALRRLLVTEERAPGVTVSRNQAVISGPV